MAEKRMLSKSITESDAFLDLPHAAQALYLHLNMTCDDDGFTNSPKRVQRLCGCSDADLDLLVEKRFLISFESGVVVVKHWRINNSIRKDRKSDTVYQSELSQLTIKDNGAYTEKVEESTLQPDANQMSTTCQPDASGENNDGCVDKDRLVEVSIEEISIDKEREHARGKYQNLIMTDQEYEQILNTYEYAQSLLDRVSEHIAISTRPCNSHFALACKIGREDGYKRKQAEKHDEKADAMPMPDDIRKALSKTFKSVGG